MAAQWKQQAILGNIPPELSAPFDAISGATGTLLQVITVVKTTLELIEGFLISSADPALEALKSVLQEIINLLNDLVGAGFYAISVDTMDHGQVITEPVDLAAAINKATQGDANAPSAADISPIATKVLNPEANIDKIIESFDDIGDTGRPQFSDSAEVGMITILGGTISPADFVEILFSILSIFNSDDLRNLGERVAKSVITESISFNITDITGEFKTQPNPEGATGHFVNGEFVSKETGTAVKFVYSSDLEAELVEGKISGARGYAIRRYRSNIEIRPQTWRIKKATLNTGIVFDLPVPNPDFQPGEIITGLESGTTAVIQQGFASAIESIQPDWANPANNTLGAFFPELEAFVGTATATLQNIIDAAQLPTQAISELIKFLDVKIQQIESLITLIDSLKNTFNTAISNTGIYTLYIPPATGGITRIKEELKGSFSEGVPPSDELNLTVSASFLVGGSTATKLIQLLASILNIG